MMSITIHDAYEARVMTRNLTLLGVTFNVECLRGDAATPRWVFTTTLCVCNQPNVVEIQKGASDHGR